MAKIITAYKYASDINLLSTIHRILGKMEGNTYFPEPPAALGMLKEQLPEFIASLTNASSRDLEMIAVKNAKKGIMIGLLTELAEYVTLTSHDDRATLLSSGFVLSREKGEASMPDIKELQVTIGPPGEAITRIKKVPGARAYLHQCTIEPLTTDSVWINEFVAEARYTFKGLQSKERYIFRVIAIGVNGKKVMSPEVKRVIQ